MDSLEAQDIENSKAVLRLVQQLQQIYANDPLAFVLWLFAAAFVLWAGYQILRRIIRWVSRWGSRFFHAAERRMIFKAAKSLKGGVETLKKELESYKAAIEALIKADLSDNARLSMTVEDFKIAAGGLTLSELPIGKFAEIFEYIWIHKEEGVYFDIVWTAQRLEAFSPSYKRFFVKVNNEYIEDIEALVTSQYHITQIKPGTDFLMQKNTLRDSERAIRYFKYFTMFVDTALNNTDRLLKNLDKVMTDNQYCKLLMWMD